MSRTAIWVDAQDGDDDGDGTVSQPFRTFVRAMQAWRQETLVGKPWSGHILLRHGEYDLDEDGLGLMQAGVVLAAEGRVFVNHMRLEVRPTRQRARA